MVLQGEFDSVARYLSRTRCLLTHTSVSFPIRAMRSCGGRWRQHVVQLWDSCQNCLTSEEAVPVISVFLSAVDSIFVLPALKEGFFRAGISTFSLVPGLTPVRA